MNASQKQKFVDLKDKYGLTKDDFFKAPQGFVIITRTGIEKIQRGMGLTVQYEVVDSLCNVDTGHYVIKGVAIHKDGERIVESYGEASTKNCRNAYPVAMAEKRALSRVVLKSSDLYELGIYGEDEIDS